MGGACAAVSKIISGGGSSSTTSKEKKNSEANKQAAGTKLAAKGDYKSPKTGFQQVKDDIQMDLGIKEKDVDYYARLDDRAARSQKALKDITAKAFESDDKPATVKPSPAPEPVKETPVAEEIKPPEPPKPVAEAEPITPVTKVDTTTEGDKAPTEPDVGAGTTTALGGEEEAAKLEQVAEGEAEKKVADTVRKGRRSTIRTTPKGLLSTAPTRRRRSLMGGLIS